MTHNEQPEKDFSLENNVDDTIRDALDILRSKDIDHDIINAHIARLEALLGSVPERDPDLRLAITRLRVRLRH